MLQKYKVVSVLATGKRGSPRQSHVYADERDDTSLWRGRDSPSCCDGMKLPTC